MKPEMGFAKTPDRHQPTKGRKPRTFHASEKLPIQTVGAIGTRTGQAFIYLGTDGTRLKAGMTSDLDQRAKALGIDILHSWPVAIAGARAVETELFQLIGHKQGDTEWIVGTTVERIVELAPEAFRRVRRWAWVDDDLTEEEARKLRIRLAGIDPALVPEPARTRRRSIIAFRKAAGTFGHHGGRF